MKTYIAIDIGASSGRHIVGFTENGEIKTREVYRFPNGMKEQDGHLVWDTQTLLEEIRRGIDLCLEQFDDIVSLSIDTWGVDYVLMKGEEEILPVYAYRDDRTLKAVEEVHTIIPFNTLYSHTGCQFQPFNTVYQLYADKLAGRLDNATDFLMMPEYFLYKLTGVRSTEFTEATTTGLISAETLGFDEEIIGTLGLPSRLFSREISAPGTYLGEYKGIKCLLCATHDTGSAVEGIPMTDNSPYISSGTWSLLGVKTPGPITGEDSMRANYSNEGGPDYNRYQKNIMGMWLINELRRELCPDKDFGRIAMEADQLSSFNETVNADDPAFLAPESMKEAFDSALKDKPSSTADYFRCAYYSLAEAYRKALCELEENTGTTYDSLYIVGGGAKNDFLNRITQSLTGKKVIALPIEATALGNIKIQMEADNGKI